MSWNIFQAYLFLIECGSSNQTSGVKRLFIGRCAYCTRFHRHASAYQRRVATVWMLFAQAVGYRRQVKRCLSQRIMACYLVPGSGADISLAQDRETQTRWSAAFPNSCYFHGFLAFSASSSACYNQAHPRNHHRSLQRKDSTSSCMNASYDASCASFCDASLTSYRIHWNQVRDFSLMPEC